MGNFELLPIDHSFNNEMLSILKSSPIHANGLSLYFDKSPDIFEISRMKYPDSRHLGFFFDGKLKGFASLGYYDAFVHGELEKIFTFYHFYLLPEVRGKQISKLAMKDFFLDVRSKANYGLSIILKGNQPPESYIGKRKDEWMPPTKMIDELVVNSILFALPKKNETIYKVRNARLEDIPVIISLLKAEHINRDFGLVFQEDKFMRNLENRKLKIENYFVAMDRRGEIKGVCLAWDCSTFRNTSVLNYSASFYTSLFAYKTLEKFFPLAPFPKKGESFKELTITDYAVSNRDPIIIHALLSEIYNRHKNRKYHFMNWASCGSDPLLAAAKGFWKNKVISHIAYTSMDETRYNIKTNIPYVDIAFL